MLLVLPKGLVDWIVNVCIEWPHSLPSYFVCLLFFFFHLILLFSLLSFEVPDTRGVVANSKSLDESASLAGLQSSISPLSVLVGWTAIFFFFGLLFWWNIIYEEGGAVWLYIRILKMQTSWCSLKPWRSWQWKANGTTLGCAKSW